MSRIAKARALSRAGYTAVDVLVVLLLIGIVFFFLLMAMPRGREAARLAGCQKNLAQIGLALGLYDQTQGCLPTIGEPAPIEPPATSGSAGPLRILLETFGQTDFSALSPRRNDIPGRRPDSRRDSGAGIRLQERRQRDLGPLSRAGELPRYDRRRPPRHERRLLHRPPDQPGRCGEARRHKLHRGLLRAPGGRQCRGQDRSLELRGGGRAAAPARLHARLPRSNVGPAGTATPALPGGLPTIVPPCTTTPCRQTPRSLACRLDGESAFMGASSGHVKGVNLLMLDGSVKLVVPTIDPKVWKEFAAVSSVEEPAKSPGQ